jgi:hypothetical protein
LEHGNQVFQFVYFLDGDFGLRGKPVPDLLDEFGVHVRVLEEKVSGAGQSCSSRLATRQQECLRISIHFASTQSFSFVLLVPHDVAVKIGFTLIALCLDLFEPRFHLVPRYLEEGLARALLGLRVLEEAAEGVVASDE